MLSKLIKHEWKALFKHNLIIFITLLSTTLFVSCILIFSGSIDNYSPFAIFPAVFLYYLMILCVPIATLIIFAMRYYKSCFGNEGYLTNTLPIKPSTIVLSKLITGAIYMFIMTIFTLLSLGTVILSFLAFSKNFSMNELSFQLSTLPDFQTISSISFPFFLVFILLTLILSSFSSVSMIIGSFSFGNLWKKHKILGSIVSYAGIYFIMQILSFLFIFPSTTKLSMNLISNSDPFLFIHGYTKLMLIFIPSTSIIITLTLYIISVHILKKKINLD